MENCLVTKLKGVVNNDNLEILGGVIVHAKSNASGACAVTSVSSSRLVHIYAPDVTIINTDSNGRVIDAHSAEVSTIFTISEANKEFDFVLTNKYNLASMPYGKTFYTDNTKFLRSISDLSRFSVNISDNSIHSSIDLNDVPASNLTQLSIINSAVYGLTFTGTLNGFMNRADASLLTIVICKLNRLIEPNSDVATLFGSFTGITKFGFFGCTNMTGTVESLVAAQVTAERTEASITISEGGTLGNVTFDGGAFTGISGTQSTLKWKPTTSSTAGAVTDICLNNTAITIAADGTKVGDTTPW